MGVEKNNKDKNSKENNSKENSSPHLGFDSLPETVQHRMMRRGLNIDPTYPEDIEFSIARSTEDIKAACAILYEAYTDAGFMIEDGSGYRFTVYHALPYSYTLIAKQAGEVIATVTLIVRSTDELPIEKIFSISPYLGFGRRVVEVSALTVHPKARDNRGNGRILFPLFKYLYTIALRQLGATDLVITCNPKHLAFYKAVMLFESIGDEVKDSYDFVDGAPAAAARLDLTTVPERYDKTYSGKPPNKNVNEYILFNEFPQFRVPDQIEPAYSGNRWTPDQLAWILETLAVGRSSLSDDDMTMLREAYDSSYDDLFARFDPSAEDSSSSKPKDRIDLNVDATVTTATSNTTTKARILAISREELHLSIEADPDLRDRSPRLDFTDGDDPLSIQLRVGRSLMNDEYVFQVTPSDRAAILARCAEFSLAELRSDQWCDPIPLAQ